MFTDDIYICSLSREQVEETLGRWRYALEKRERNIRRQKTRRKGNCKKAEMMKVDEARMDKVSRGGASL